MSHAIATTGRPALAPERRDEARERMVRLARLAQDPAVEAGQRGVGLRDHDRLETGRADDADDAGNERAARKFGKGLRRAHAATEPSSKNGANSHWPFHIPSLPLD